MTVPSQVCNGHPQHKVCHDSLVPASAILTPASALSMPGVLSPYLGWLTVTPYYVSWQYRSPQPGQPGGLGMSLLAQRSQHQSQPRSISTPAPAPAPVAIRLNTSPSCGSQPQPQPRSVSASALAVSTPTHPKTFQRQCQHQLSNSVNASHLNIRPNANSSCPPTIFLAPTPALPPTVSMSAVHASTRPSSKQL